MLEIVSGAVPLFARVACCVALVVPTRCEPKERLDVRVTAGAGCVPVPLRETDCGLPAALSAMETLADRGPTSVGENVAEIVQVALAASVSGASGQSLVCAKSPAFVPMTPMLVIVRGAAPEFRRVDVWAELVVPRSCEPKDRLVGVNVTAGAWPVPVSATVWGLPLASSVTDTLAVRAPPALGVKLTEIVQLPPAASVDVEVGQVLVCA